MPPLRSSCLLEALRLFAQLLQTFHAAFDQRMIIEAQKLCSLSDRLFHRQKQTRESILLTRRDLGAVFTLLDFCLAFFDFRLSFCLSFFRGLDRRDPGGMFLFASLFLCRVSLCQGLGLAPGFVSGRFFLTCRNPCSRSFLSLLMNANGFVRPPLMTRNIAPW